MSIPFAKMNGLGNDFAVFDLRAGTRAMTAEAAIAIADRRTGVGCDTVIVIERARGRGDAYMAIWNADGSDGGQCGNAARCVAQTLMAEKGRETCLLDTPAGLLAARLAGSGLIAVDMGAPRLEWEDIPLSERMDTRRIDLKLGPLDNPYLWGPSAVSMGNPHAVFFVDDLRAYQLDRIGPLVEHHPLFPERANVSLAQVLAPDRITLKVWERGVGATQACGTAACATVVAGVRRGLTERAARVDLPGGTLAIEWRESDGHVLMTGPAETSFTGALEGRLAALLAALKAA
jgi:diaminopimelate epimerase